MAVHIHEIDPGFNQVAVFLRGAKIDSAELLNPQTMCLNLGGGRGRLILTGQFNLDMQPGNKDGSSDVTDVEARMT
jgi:hypothetical protein